jgi:16S rRNA (uracil1498-N3)-methyltransferase
MSTPTFYIEQDMQAGDRIDLEGKEAWHAIGVKRLNVDDPVRLINGRGSVAMAKVENITGRYRAMLAIETVNHVPPIKPDIILATAVAKGDRQSIMLDMATQLGMNSWQPLACRRSVSKIGKNSYQRWQKVCLEACKQSGAAWLPELLPAAMPAEVAKQAVAGGREVLLAHPDGEKNYPVSAADKMLMVGPEGGFTDDEVEKTVAAGARIISLGFNILRIETAAISLLARCRLD